ncbi:MAG: Protein of unknown function (DUF3326) [Phormidesmis priestleyi Ana]|uniref:DUF3326 domain-containing protein n=1 Tax=Phormidesmis priestleyi Ana TaxID=1666911 RepID=A0A0P7YVC1_9CYAN|nr:MAG: Protein of unknown function (DUF3326) [Phormidesmis priestleyi Ana]
MSQPKLHTTVLIIPTGIGAAIGGYAGDALPVARMLAQVTDRLITHPNVMNGAQMYWPMPNAYYVEGYGLDQFAAGRWDLQAVHQNPIGLVIDSAVEDDLRWRHLQAADAARATLGLDIRAHVVTDRPLGVTLKTAESGASWGTLENPGSLLRATERLINEGNVSAIAVIARFPDDEGSTALEAYRQGQGVDPLAGAEAVISHLVVRTFKIPCAHAPALAPIALDPTISPRSAAEELGHTFLPCVLAGLSRAPQFVEVRADSVMDSSVIKAEQVDAVIVPATAFGGSAVMSLAQARRLTSSSGPQIGPQIISVGENSTTMAVSASALGIPAIAVNTYLEAAGLIAAYRAGVAPAALRPRMKPLGALGTLPDLAKSDERAQETVF